MAAQEHTMLQPRQETSVESTDVSVLPILGRDSIHLGYHLIPHIVHTVLTSLPSSTYVLVTDKTLSALYGNSFANVFQQALSEANRPSRFLQYAIPPGEQSKSRSVKAEIEDFMLAQRCTRDTVILALGGGVVGDLVGFVAATFMRGVKYVQIPTTLLAMVDSAVGGKTAIDTPLGKNLIGAFHQPSYIFIDAAFLSTLPLREFQNGMAEVIKTAAIWSEDEFTHLEKGVETIKSAVLSPPKPTSQVEFPGRSLKTRTEAQALLLSVILGSIAVKSHIVTIDERETGLRNLVNFGHTIGHALEAVLTPHILHGECVAVGMVLEAEVARSLGHLSAAAVARIQRCLKAHGLPTTVKEPKIAKSINAIELNTDRLMDVMKVDKKNSGSTKKIVLLSKIGQTIEDKASAVEDHIISRVLSESMIVKPFMLRDSLSQQAVPVKITPPGSKSISNRALVLAALSKGTCRLKNLLHSDDTAVMMQALEDMGGADFSWEDGGDTLVVSGKAGALQPPSNGKEIYLGNAGTAARFLTSVCALAKSANNDTIVVTGNQRMKQRPIGPLVTALNASGVSIDYIESEGCLPLRIPTTGFKGGRIQLAASISSQYVSSILLSAPYAQEPVTLELVGGQVISQPYIDMTIAMMEAFGVTVQRLPNNIYQIPTQAYVAPAVYEIESDASSATYPLAVAAITGTSCIVTNIGSASLQGDARFAKEVLEPMGCTVEQTPTSTLVTGPSPGQLRAIAQVDMEPMTDAFLTASVLAAVASLPPKIPVASTSSPQPISTNIYGIANQRVKECDRIDAMITQLAKFGVRAENQPDGIQVFPTTIDKLKKDARIHCYDDHRVAMAFSVLAAVPNGPGAIIDERRCVEKTWPGWWDAISHTLGVEVEGVAPLPPTVHKESRGVPPMRSFEANASILLIGMRGAGKSHVGRIGASALGIELIDADRALEQKVGLLCPEIVAQQGWPAFRRAETLLLKELLRTKSKGCIISLGGGIVETPEARALLQAYAATQGPVVQVVRDIDEIVNYLNSDPSRPSLGEPLHDIYKRRQPWFQACSNYEVVTHLPQTEAQVLPNGAGTSRTDPLIVRRIKGSQASVGQFLSIISSRSTNYVNLSPDHRSYMLSMTYPDITAALPHMHELSIGVDAIEFRADLLSPNGVSPKSPQIPPSAYVALQLAKLRQTTLLPIIFTVRTHSQGGFFPDHAEDAMFELLALAIRLGCEYVDIEVGHDMERTLAFAHDKGITKIIASWHEWSGKTQWDDPVVGSRYEQAAMFGDIIKIVLKANDMTDNFKMINFRKAMEAKKPLLTLNMGLEGRLSRVLNPVLSPVTHERMPSKAAPGQLTFGQIQSALHLVGDLPAKKFFLFGTPIAHSKSPLIHNTGFHLLGLPHEYGRHEIEKFDAEATRIIRSPDFGGASVTIPVKLDVMQYLDSLTPHAKLIGAVNTIIPQRDGTLLGENTDWLAIRDMVKGAISQLVIQSGASALVLGAGGTCRAAMYALHAVGFQKIYLFNRTRKNADLIVEAFPAEYNIVVLDDLGSLAEEDKPAAIVSTVPANHTTTSEHNRADGAVYIPRSIFSTQDTGVVIDMAYKPKRTPLIELAESLGWPAIPGITLLLQQAYHQFELWTGRQAPRSIIENVVMAAFNAEV